MSSDSVVEPGVFKNLAKRVIEKYSKNIWVNHFIPTAGKFLDVQPLTAFCLAPLHAYITSVLCCTRMHHASLSF